jgi:hypothetical protein
VEGQDLVARGLLEMVENTRGLLSCEGPSTEPIRDAAHVPTQRGQSAADVQMCNPRLDMCASLSVKP